MSGKEKTNGSLAMAPRVITIPAASQENIRKLRVAAYARVSSNSEDQKHSFAAQNAYFSKLITDNPDWELADIYADQGITGTSIDKRDDFLRMMGDCRKGRIDRILVKSSSRFARNTKESLEAVRELAALGVSVYFEEQNIDTAQVSGEVLIAMFAALAQRESEAISNRRRWSYQLQMSKGRFNTYQAPLGFTRIDDELKIVPEEAAVIRRIFEEYLSGANSREIAQRLNDGHVLDLDWKYKLIDYILKNERYAGNALLQKRYTTDAGKGHGSGGQPHQGHLPQRRRNRTDRRPTQEEEIRMIYVTGDCHGNFARFEQKNFPEQANMTKDDTVIITGDFGGVWFGDSRDDETLDWLERLPFTLAFVCGNHENYDALERYPVAEWHGGKVHRIRPHVLHLMRGQIFELEGCRFFTMGGAKSHDIEDGILEPDTPDFERRLTMLQRKPRARYRINHISWWAQELPSDEEYAEARRNLDAVGWQVDYIITHCAPTSIALMGSRHNEADRLTDFLQDVQKRAKYHYWLFGHYHDNKAVDEKHILLWEQIVQIC